MVEDTLPKDFGQKYKAQSNNTVDNEVQIDQFLSALSSKPGVLGHRVEVSFLLKQLGWRVKLDHFACIQDHDSAKRKHDAAKSSSISAPPA